MKQRAVNQLVLLHTAAVLQALLTLLIVLGLQLLRVERNSTWHGDLANRGSRGSLHLTDIDCDRDAMLNFDGHGDCDS